MLRSAIVTALALATTVGASRARADVRTYLGPHPIDLAGHWHFEEGLHPHDALPIGAGPFGEVDGALVFLADPLEWGFDGDVWTYRGAHPLPGGVQAYCGIAGDHRHEFAPEGAYRFDEASAAHVYAGALRGGVAMITPGRAAPPQPIVVAGSRPPIAPYWYPGGGGSAYAPPRRAVQPRPLPTALDGRYTRVESRRATATRRLDAPRQHGQR